MSEQTTTLDLEARWAPLYFSPESERATFGAAMLPASERQAYLDSLPPVEAPRKARPPLVRA